MRHNMARFCVVTTALAAAVAIAPSATAAPPANSGTCKSGSFTAYFNPATGTSFTTQGQCVSFIATGGTLQKTLLLDLRFRTVAAPPETICAVDLFVSQATPGEYLVVDRDTGLQNGPYTFRSPVKTDGTAEAWIGTGQSGYVVTATVNGQTITETIDCGRSPA